jgi:hypothetical protein
LKPRAEVAAAAAGKKLDRSIAGGDGKETVISGDSHCAQCGTPKSMHVPLQHEFVAGDDVRPASVGGSAPVSDRSVKPSTDTLAADQARIDKIPAWDRAKNAPVGSTPALPPKPLPPKPPRPGSLKEDINRLPPVDQMRAWRQLIEAPSDAQQAAQRAGLGRPGSIGVGNKPDARSLADKLKDIDRQRFDATSAIDHTPVGSTNSPAGATASSSPPSGRDFNNFDRQVPKPKVPQSTAGFLRSAEDLIRDRAAAQTATAPPPPAPPAAPADWKAKVKFGLRKIANPAFAVYTIYEGWQQIMTLWDAHKQGKLSDQQFAAETTKIVAKLAEEYGIVQVSIWLGGIAGGAATGGAGAIPGMVAGAAAGIGLEHYFGGDISSVVNNVIDYLYSTDKKPAPAPQENKPTPAEVAENKTYLEGMAVWMAAGGQPDERDKKEMDAAKAVLKAAGATVATVAAPAGPASAPAKGASTDKEGDTGMLDGKKVIFRNGKWVLQ